MICEGALGILRDICKDDLLQSCNSFMHFFATDKHFLLVFSKLKQHKWANLNVHILHTLYFCWPFPDFNGHLTRSHVVAATLSHSFTVSLKYVTLL